MGIRDESGGRMKPQDYSVYELMSPRQYRIPVYQRPYSWAEKQVKSLLDDITKIITSTLKTRISPICILEILSFLKLKILPRNLSMMLLMVNKDWSR